jgi:receptor expression-enhancing protein 1/2/3/4
MAVMTAVQPVLDTFVFWVPLYYEAKLAFVIYLLYPQLAGTTYLYHTYFEPMVTR